MMDRCETFRECSPTIPLSSLKVSYLYTIPCGFYDSSNEQNWMCELCTFSQIRSHIHIDLYVCMCVFIMLACICICTYICMYVHMYLCMYICTVYPVTKVKQPIAS